MEEMGSRGSDGEKEEEEVRRYEEEMGSRGGDRRRWVVEEEI